MTSYMIYNTVSEKRGHAKLSLPHWSRVFARNASTGKQTDLVLLDFSKAFDKVYHSRLLWKFHQYRVRGNSLHWIRAFLGNRSQTVVLDGEESGMSCIRWALQSALLCNNTLPKSAFVTVFGPDSLSETERCIATRQNKMAAPDIVRARLRN